MRIADPARRIAALALCVGALAACGSRPERTPEAAPDAAEAPAAATPDARDREYAKRIERVHLLGRNGQLEAAQRACERAIEIADTAEARALRGEILARRERYAEAAEALRDAIALEDTSVRARYWIGFCYLRLGRYGDAEPHLDRAIELDPSLPWPYRDRGDIRAADGRIEAGLADLDRAAELSRGEVSVLERRAHWRLKAGRNADALRDVRAAIEKGSTDPSLWLLQWRACVALGHAAEAETAIRRAVEALPATLRTHGDDEHWIYDARMAFADAGRFDALVAVLNHVLGRDRDDLWGLDQRAWAHTWRGDAAAALADAERALAIDPGREYAERMAGGAEYRLGRFADAIARADRIIARDPSNEPALRLRGQAALATGDAAAARADADRLIAAGHRRSGRELLVELHGARGEWDEALEVLDALVEEAPDDVGLLHRRAVVHGEVEAFEDALDDIDRAIRIAGPGASDEAHVIRAMCLAGLERWADARKAIDAVITRVPTFAMAYRLRAEIRMRQGDVAGAQDDNDRAVELEFEAENPDR